MRIESVKGKGRFKIHMTQKRQYRVTPGYSFHRVEADRAVLLHETRSFSLIGELYVRVLAEIDKNCPDIITELGAAFPSAEIYYALSLMESNGCISQIDPDAERHSWWSSIERGDAVGKVLRTPIAVSGASSYFKRAMSMALADAGFLKIVEMAESRVVVAVCSDYLESEVSVLQKNAFDKGAVYFFPVKLAGRNLWLGPLFKKDQKPCWHCLKKALQKNRPLEHYLSDNSSQPVLPSYPTSNVSLQFGIHAAIMHLIRKMVHEPDGDSELIAVDMPNLTMEKHCVRTRPQCEACGDPSIFSRQINSPVELGDRGRQFTDNGGYRTIAPESTWENHKHLVSPLTGIVSHIDKYDKKNHRLRPVWKATYFVNPSRTTAGRNERFVKNSFGKGCTAEQSRASALCEAIERYSFLYAGEEPRIRATYSRLGQAAVDPETLQHFSARQYASRVQSNKLESPQKIPLPFDPEREISWTPVWSLTSKVFRQAPLQYCYCLTPTPAHEDMCPFSSNGCAAGNCLEEALLQGLLELIERDATAIWWYNRIARPGINLESFNDRYFHEIKKHYREMQWDLWVLDATHDLHIPSVVALAKNKKNGHFAVGLGCHLSMRLAIQRAITEMHQIFDPAGTHDPVWSESDIENPAFLYPEDRRERGADYWTPPPDRSLKEDILECIEKIKNAGMDVLVVNYTRPDIRVPAVKVIVPGLRHFWKQLGPGRLYTVPVKMNWLAQELAEDSMNPKELAL